MRPPTECLLLTSHDPMSVTEQRPLVSALSGPDPHSDIARMIASIDKSDWAVSDPDPLEHLLHEINLLAPGEFWQEFNDGDIQPTVSRVRNWLLKMIKADRRHQCGSALEFLAKLKLSPEILAHIKLSPILKALMSASSVADAASRLAVQCGITVAPSPSPVKRHGSPPSSELAIPKRQDRKRSREEEAPPQKRRKLKSVKWQLDEQLKKVREFDLELEPTVLGKEYIAAHEAKEEVLTPFHPPLSARPLAPQIRAIIGIKRGGTLQPPQSLANNGPVHDPSHSPKEPPEREATKGPLITIEPF